MVNQIRLVDFSKLLLLPEKAFYPICFSYGKVVIIVDSWEQLMKVTFYTLCIEEKNKNRINNFINKRFGKSNRIYITDNQYESGNFTKFSSNLYVRYFNNYWKGDLLLIKKICLLSKVKIYISEELNEKQLQKFILKKQKSGFKIRKSKYFIPTIDREIMNSKEILFKKICIGFDEKNMLGDICLNDEEEQNLTSYFKVELTRLNSNQLCFYPLNEKVFCVALVYFAMRYYSQNRFWYYFKDVFGINVDANKQGIINETFKKIMVKYKKLYDLSILSKVDNISMHSLVTDKCSAQFFDFLFAFWRIDLNRDFENMDENPTYFNKLLAKIEKNYDGGVVANVMHHTSIALKLNPKGFKIRIRRILKTIDMVFWENFEIPFTSNRINSLLRNWSVSSKSFLSELDKKTKNNFMKGNKIYRSPILFYSQSKKEVYIKLPREIIESYSNKIQYYWEICFADKIIKINCSIIDGESSVFTDEAICEIPNDSIFCSFDILFHSSDSLIKYKIPSSSFKLFEYSGKLLNFKSETIKTGINFYICKKDSYSLNNVEKELVLDNDFFSIYKCNFVYGELLKFPGDELFIVGRKIEKGILSLGLLENCYADYNYEKYTVFNRKPVLFFSCSDEQFNGSILEISNCKETRKIRVKDLKLEKNLFNDEDELKEGYLIYFDDLFNGDGFYKILLNIPNDRTNYSYNVCYIEGFCFSFVDAPYFFSLFGTIVFGKENLIIKKGNRWEADARGTSLVFRVDGTMDEYVKDEYLCFMAILHDCNFKIFIDIPSLYWKFHENDEWNSFEPSEMYYKYIPNLIFLKGPFNFYKSYIYADYDYQDDIDDDDHFYGNYNLKNQCYIFNIKELLSELHRSENSISLKIHLNSKDYSLFSILCHSKVVSENITADKTNGVLLGNFEIKGDKEYFVNIYFEKKPIAEGILLNHGSFSIEMDIFAGLYKVIVFEGYVDLKSGDYLSYAISEPYELYVVDTNEIDSNCSAIISGIYNINKSIKELDLKRRYLINNFVKINGEEQLALDFSTWRDNFDYKKTNLYYANLCIIKPNNTTELVCPIIVSLFNNEDSSVCFIFNIDKEECLYDEMLYDSKAMWLINNEDNALYRKNTFCLNDDMFYFKIQFIGEKQ